MNGWVAFGFGALWAFLAALSALANARNVKPGEFRGGDGLIVKALYEGALAGLFALFLLLLTVTCLGAPIYLGVLAFQGETDWIVAVVTLPITWFVAFFSGIFFFQLFLGEDW